MKIFLKTEDELELMRQANQLVGRTLGELAKHIKSGVTTLQLDKIADEFIRDHGAVPTFKGFPNPYGGPFPASICTSVNDVVVHGVPSDNVVLKDGDIISVDCGTLLNGFNGDSAYTFCVGEVTEEVKQLLQVTKAKDSFKLVIGQLKQLTEALACLACLLFQTRHRALAALHLSTYRALGHTFLQQLQNQFLSLHKFAF